jgi:anti-sigma B factor antagonist
MINIDTQLEGDMMTIKVMGDVDASSSIELDNAIKRAVSDGLKKILINGQELHYISSAGLGVFMSYLQDFEKQSIKMALFGLNEKVENVFKILGLDQLIHLVDTEEEAKTHMNEA